MPPLLLPWDLLATTVRAFHTLWLSVVLLEAFCTVLPCTHIIMDLSIFASARSIPVFGLSDTHLFLLL